MSDWVVPIVSAALALAGGVYATRGKRATDRGDLADRLVDQIQEERDKADAKIERRDATIADLRRLRQRDADYIVRLRRQVEELGGEPEPYPGMTV